MRNKQWQNKHHIWNHQCINKDDLEQRNPWNGQLKKNTGKGRGMGGLKPMLLAQNLVSVKEGQDKLPTLYWLPKLHNRPYKARFIANSSSCTTTELSKLLTSCLTAIRKHVIRYCVKVYERSGKNLFWSIKNSNEVLNKLKSRSFRASSLSTYDFSTLYTTLPHIL